MRRVKEYEPPVIGIKNGRFVAKGGKGVKTFAFNKRHLDTVRNTIMTIRYEEMLSKLELGQCLTVTPISNSKLTKITSIGCIENYYLVICNPKDREIIEVDSFWTCTKYYSAFSKRGMARDGHCWGRRCWRCKKSDYRARGKGGGIPIRNFCDHKLEFLREVSRLKLKNGN